MAEKTDVVARISADDKALDRDLAGTRRKIGRAGADAARDFKKSWSAAFGTFAGLLGVDGVNSIMTQGRDVLEFQKRITRLGISGRASAAQMQELERAIWSGAKAMGVEHEQLLAGAETFTERTGRLTEYTDALKAYTNVVAATGAEGADVAKIGASLSTSLGVVPQQMEAVFDALAYGAQQGSVEFRNMAGLFSELLPQMALFKTQGADAAVELQALLQMTATGFSTAEEAGTGLRALMDTLIKRASRIKSMGGVDVFGQGADGTRKLRGLRDIVIEIGQSRLMRDPKKLQDALGGRGEAFRAMLALTQKVNGKNATERFNELADAGAAAGTVARDAATWQESAAAKMQSAQEKLAQFFNDELKDKIGTIASALSKVADVLGIAASNADMLIAAFIGSKINGAVSALNSLAGGVANVAAAGGGGGGGVGGVPAAAGAAAAGPQNSSLATAIATAVGWKIGTSIGDQVNKVLPADALASVMPHNAATEYQQNRGQSGPGVPTYRDFQYGRDRGKTLDLAIDKMERADELELGYEGRFQQEDEEAHRAATLAPEGSAKFMDAYMATRAKREAERKAEIEALRTESVTLRFQAGDEKTASARKQKRWRAEAAMALDAAIQQTGSAAYFAANPDKLGPLQMMAGQAAAKNPMLGFAMRTGETELLTAQIVQLVAEIRKLNTTGGLTVEPHPVPLDDGHRRRRRGGS
jgi:hypothetical protein